MTKQITIKEDGVSKSESVDFINTQVAGGSANWMPEDDAQEGVFYVHANGEYVPSDYGFYGFFAVGVMVPGGNGAETIQPGSLTPTYVTPLPATGLGASVIGVDPTDGAMYRMEIQDVDGVPTMVKTKVADSKADYKPTSMNILIKPAKLSYNAGEKINYAGLVVQLLDSTGYTFVDDRFPQGIISWSPVKNLLHPEYDLITPIETASGVDSRLVEPIYLLEMHIGSPLERSDIEKPNYIYEMSNTEPVYQFATMGGNPYTIIYGSKQPFSFNARYAPGWHVVSVLSVEYTVDDETIYVSRSFFLTPTPPAVEISASQKVDMRTALLIKILGGKPSAQSIPVQWKSPYDGSTYEDTFEIEVSSTESPSGVSDSSEGGSSGGGGGGHSF